jgi:hypothetical protein
MTDEIAQGMTEAIYVASRPAVDLHVRCLW